MLVLTRNANQSIMIGHDIVVTVLEIRGDQVRLGIRAPRSIDVHREEVYAALQRANRTAATSTERTLSALGGLPKSGAAEKVAAKKSKATSDDGSAGEGETDVPS
jgi:carbon storage regulator